jgi:hypothetical protein
MRSGLLLRLNHDSRPDSIDESKARGPEMRTVVLQIGVTLDGFVHGA